VSPILQLPLLDLAEVSAPTPRNLVYTAGCAWMISYNNTQRPDPGRLIRFNAPTTDLHDQTIIPLPPEQRAATDLLVGPNGKLYLACQAARTRNGTIIVEIDPVTLAQRTVLDDLGIPEAGPGPRICVGGGFGWMINYGPGDGTQPGDGSTIYQLTEDFASILNQVDLPNLSRGNSIAYDAVNNEIVFSCIINGAPGVVGRCAIDLTKIRTMRLNANELVPCYHFALGPDGSMLTSCETSTALIRVAPNMTVSRLSTCLPGNVPTWRVDAAGGSLIMSHPFGGGNPAILTQIDPVSLAMQLFTVTPPVGTNLKTGNENGLVAVGGNLILAFSNSPKSFIGRAALPGVPT